MRKTVLINYLRKAEQEQAWVEISRAQFINLVKGAVHNHAITTKEALNFSERAFKIK